MYLTDTLYFREQGCKDPWLFLESKRGQSVKILEKHRSATLVVRN